MMATVTGLVDGIASLGAAGVCAWMREAQGSVRMRPEIAEQMRHLQEDPQEAMKTPQQKR